MLQIPGQSGLHSEFQASMNYRVRLSPKASKQTKNPELIIVFFPGEFKSVKCGETESVNTESKNWNFIGKYLEVSMKVKSVTVYYGGAKKIRN